VNEAAKGGTDLNLKLGADGGGEETGDASEHDAHAHDEDAAGSQPSDAAHRLTNPKRTTGAAGPAAGKDTSATNGQANTARSRHAAIAGAVTGSTTASAAVPAATSEVTSERALLEVHGMRRVVVQVDVDLGAIREGDRRARRR
jgi:hypothetical protein